MTDSRQLRVTVFFFHPFRRKSLINRHLAEALRNTSGIEVRDLYELYPDFGIDVEAEQAVLERTDIVVFQHPYYWYNCPALMKEWLDVVLEQGWAYGPGGDRLTGKYWWQVITTGGGPAAYSPGGQNQFTTDELLRPFEQSARICGMLPLKPMLVQSTYQLSEAAIRAEGVRYREKLIAATRGELPA